MPSIDFAEVRQRAPVPTVLRALGCSPTQDPGGQWRAYCPIHGSRVHGRGTLSATAEKFTCHKCRAHGDVIDLVALACALTAPAAARRACDMACVGVPLLKPRRLSARPKREQD